jgi:hypothetical protein
MKFKTLLLMAATITKVFSYKEQNTTAAVFTENYDLQDASVTPWITAQQINCDAAKDVVTMWDLSGLPDPGWDNNVIPAMQKLARSFEISFTAARFKISNRYSTTYNGYWCEAIEWYSNANSNINLLLAAIKNMPCNVLSLIGLGSLIGSLIGSRRPNTPVEILIVTDGKLQNSGFGMDEVNRVLNMGGVRFVCAGVGALVDYNYLRSICGSNVFKITNYAAIINSVDQIANNICNGFNTPTTTAPTSRVTLGPTNMPTNKTPSPILTFRPTTFGPSKTPTRIPTKYPTKKRRTKYPTKAPTNYPTKKTTANPSVATDAPTNTPTVKRAKISG